MKKKRINLKNPDLIGEIAFFSQTRIDLKVQTHKKLLFSQLKLN